MSTLNERYINPLTDFGFKQLSGSELNKDLLVDFLNQVLPVENQIIDLEFSNNKYLGNNELDRKAIYDLYCKGTSGERFIVELQKAKQNFFKDRSVYYASFPIQEQAKKGDWNYRLEPVFTVGILDFEFDEHRNNTDVLHYVELKDQHCEVFYNKLKFIYIELPKFKKKLDELDTRFEKWLYVFRHLPDLEEQPDEFKDSVFQKLFDSAEIAKFDTEQRLAYEQSLKYYRDIKNVVDTAKDEGAEEECLATLAGLLDFGASMEVMMAATRLSEQEVIVLLKILEDRAT